MNEEARHTKSLILEHEQRIVLSGEVKLEAGADLSREESGGYALSKLE